MASADTDHNGGTLASGPARELDPDSQEWLSALSADGPVYEQACARLHGRLLRIAFQELHRRQGGHRISGPELDDLAHQAAADALVSIVRKIGQFRGESRFTTWAFKFVIFEVSNKTGRHFWRSGDVPLENEDWERLPARLGAGPDELAQAGETAAALRAAVDDVLTAHQRRIFVSLVLQGVPLDALVVELGTNRNAVYKTMFDARRKLRLRLEAQGLLGEEARERS